MIIIERRAVRPPFLLIMDKNQIKESVLGLLEPHLADGNIFVVDMKITISKILSKIIILLDSDEGIRIDQCAIISRALGNDMEDKDFFESNYNIEVSSPGIDMPLKFARQYPRNIGRNLQIILKNDTECLGKLTEVNSESITIIEEKKRKKNEEIIPLVFSLEDIKESFVQVSFK